jgi:BirA family biotin operon repressor/biotin-[acetyl-CoA-carboxylase] ligase
MQQIELELLEASQIWAELSTNSQQRLAHLDILDSVDSTNSYAFAQQDKAVPYACLAEYQTSGRGQHGRQWLSPYASGLCLSLKHRYATLNQPLAGLNIALAVTVVRVLHTLGASEVGIKWPNDVIWQNCKLAGLLLESRHANQKYEIVIGIGMNIKMPQIETTAITQAWVDLYTVLGHSISRNKLAAMLIEQCLETLLNYPQLGLVAFMDDWHCFDLSYGKTVTLKIPQKGFVTGTAWGINELGALRVDKQDYAYGEVSLRL